jgi:hypothetical protein
VESNYNVGSDWGWGSIAPSLPLHLWLIQDYNWMKAYQLSSSTCWLYSEYNGVYFI